MTFDHQRVALLGVLSSSLLLMGCPSNDSLPIGTSEASDDDSPSLPTNSSDPSNSTSQAPQGPTTTSVDATTHGLTGSLSSSTTGETDTDETYCGDGIVDPDEECDDGTDESANAYNGSDQVCNTDCSENFCGDGIKQEAREEACDAGENNSDEYGGCTTQCTLGPRCGDNELQQGYELCECIDQAPVNGLCDFETEDGTIVACDANTCRFDGKLVFLAVSADDQGWQGNIAHGQMNGIEAADWICDDLADKAGLTSLPAENDNVIEPRFRAWLSAEGASVLDRFTKSDTGYVLRSGVVVANDWTQLITQGPLVPINHTQHEGDIRSEAYVWSNTDKTGKRISATETCDDWTVNEVLMMGRVGEVDNIDVAPWTDATSFNPSSCFSYRYLYCFEQ